jgi:hypothetical protein
MKEPRKTLQPFSESTVTLWLVSSALRFVSISNAVDSTEARAKFCKNKVYQKVLKSLKEHN